MSSVRKRAFLYLKNKDQKPAMDFSGGKVVKKWPANEETRVRSLVQEDFTCCRASKPMHRNY